MGSYGTLARQCVVLVLVELLTAMTVGLLVSREAAFAVGIAAATALVFFVVVSVRRHREVARLAAEIDEVLYEGRRIDFSTCREGDVAVLSSELAKMVARLTRTAAQLDEERSALSDALADISHQVRTPLTAMNLMLPAIERADDPMERRALTRRLEHMIDRVGWLVTALLRIARLDAGAMTMEKRPVSAVSMIERAVAPLRTAYDVRGIELTIRVTEDASFLGDERWSAEALENIVKNCMEHTPEGGRVTITAEEDALATTIVVVDSGPGIAAEDLPHVFERFYRRNSGSDDEAEGFGIGLSLTRALITAQGGIVRAANDPDQGARFEIAFPKLVV